MTDGQAVAGADEVSATDSGTVGGCCGTTVLAAEPATGDAAAQPCCGTAAQASGGCCGAEAKSAAVAAGAGCCR